MGNPRSNAINLNGKRFGRLVVGGKPPRIEVLKASKVYLWECTCDCGKVIEVKGRHLREHRASSCGCDARKVDSDVFLSRIDEYTSGGFEAVSILPTVEGFIRFLNTNGVSVSPGRVRKAIDRNGLGDRFVSGIIPGARTWTVDRFRFWKVRPPVLDNPVLGVDSDGLPSYGENADRNLFEFLEDQLMFRWATETDRWKLLRMARELFDARRAVVRQRGLLQGEPDGCVEDGRFATV